MFDLSDIILELVWGITEVTAEKYKLSQIMLTVISVVFILLLVGICVLLLLTGLDTNNIKLIILSVVIFTVYTLLIIYRFINLKK